MKIVKVVSRDYPLVYAEVAHRGVIKMREELGWGFSRRMFKMSESARDSYFLEEDFREFKKHILAESPGLLSEAMNVAERECRAFCEFIAIPRNLRGLSDKELAQVLREFVTLFADGVSNYWIVFKLPDYYTEERVLETTADEAKRACFEKAFEIRRDTDGIFEEGFAYARTILREAGSRASVAAGLMDYATAGEVTAFLEEGTPLDAAELEERSRGMFYTGDEVIVGKNLGVELEKIGYELEPEEDHSNVESVNGTPAFKGRVRGVARIVMRLPDAEKVREGDVLVAPMTSPDFVPAMKRASAFVTDEGGVTCHAAIVAREFAKPCVVGTKIATKAFKDGDIVEVDAENGVVKKVG
jgi:phosphohistidine swiveling domain-containing protein